MNWEEWEEKRERLTLIDSELPSLRYCNTHDYWFCRDVFETINSTVSSIFQLGNALGFVRSMKAAADLVVSDALVYDREEETTER